MKYPEGLQEGMVAFQWGHRAGWSVSSPYLLIHSLEFLLCTNAGGPELKTLKCSPSGGVAGGVCHQ